MLIAFSPAQITAIVQPVRSLGSTAETIRNIAPLDTAGPGDLSFLSNAKYRLDVPRCQASVLLLPLSHAGEPPPGQLWLFLENPSVGLTRLCRSIEQLLWTPPPPGVHPTAVVDPSAEIGIGVCVGPLCVIEAGVRIGAGTFLQAAVFVGRDAVIGRDCRLMARTVVAHSCVLGDRVWLQPGAIIGADGYGYDTVAGRHEKIPQIGHVVVENDVEIGANSTIDRARFSRTLIGEGTKIDNLVHVGHNCVIGKHCLLIAQVGIAGSTTLGDYVVLAGQVGVADHMHLGSYSQVGGGSAITRDLAPRSHVNGSRAIPYILEQKFQILRSRLPELFRRVERLEEQLGIPPTKKPSS